MKIRTFLFVVAILLVACGSTTRIWVNQSDAVPQNNVSAPEECTAVFTELMGYIGKRDPDLIKDTEAQNRFLTKSMRTAVSERVKLLEVDPDPHDVPSNATFRGVWNSPSTYRIAGSRRYDHTDSDNQNDNRAIIDVLYEWDSYSDGINNRYPGEKTLYSFIFVFEDGSWKLDDIYTFDDEYASTNSLKIGLQKH